MATNRQILADKIKLENNLFKKLLPIHKKVLLEAEFGTDINLLKYKADYQKVFEQANRNIGLVNDIDLYNSLFIQESLEELGIAFQNFLIKGNIPVIKAFLTKKEQEEKNQSLYEKALALLLLLLPAKTMRDAQFFTQKNYENQNLIKQVAEAEAVVKDFDEKKAKEDAIAAERAKSKLPPVVDSETGKPTPTVATEKEIEKEAEKTVAKAKKKAIQDAETEVQNDAMSAVAAKTPIKTKRSKRWVAIIDNRTRQTHFEANGQVKKVNQPFTVGGSRLNFPGDTSFGAPMKEIMNCRCTVRII